MFSSLSISFPLTLAWSFNRRFFTITQHPDDVKEGLQQIAQGGNRTVSQVSVQLSDKCKAAMKNKALKIWKIWDLWKRIIKRTCTSKKYIKKYQVKQTLETCIITQVRIEYLLSAGP